MSELRDFRRVDVSDMPGQRSALAADDLPADQGAALARNVEFFEGRVETRRGFTNAFTAVVASRVEHMRQWLMPTWSRLLMFVPHAATPSVRYRNLTAVLEDNVVTGLASTVTTADFQEYGSRMLMAFIGDDGLGKARPRIWNGLFTSAPIVDQAFAAPPSNYTPGYADFGSGVVDAGAHAVGLLFQTRNGFTVKAVELASLYTAPGGASFQLTLSPSGTWGAEWSYVEVLFSTVQNPERLWIVPQSKTAIPGGTSAAVNILIDVSDTALAALNAEIAEATPYFSTYAWGDGGVNINAKALISYSGRMVYIFDAFDAVSLGDVSYAGVSDVGDPQRLRLDQNLVRLPGNLPIVTGAVLHNLLYLIGPAWIFSISDNLGKPVTWGEAQLVDARVGTPCVHGVGKDPSRNIIFIANAQGLWAFDGAQIPDKPVSYYQTDQWQRINWSAPRGALKVLVDGGSSRVLVLAPLDEETVPTSILSWNYRNGHSYQRVDFALIDFDYATLADVGGIASVVYNQIPELWLANRSTPNEVQRQKSVEAGDASIYQDGSSGYTCEYETGMIPPEAAAPLNVHAAHLAVSGAGTLALTAIAKGGRSRALSPITLAASPAKLELRRISMKTEGFRLKLSNGGVAAARWALSRVIAYWQNWTAQR